MASKNLASYIVSSEEEDPQRLFDSIQYLLNNDYDVNSEDRTYTPLQIMVTRGPEYDKILELLFKHGADPNARDYLYTLMACPDPNPETIKLLLKFGVNPNKVTYGKTPLIRLLIRNSPGENMAKSLVIH